jgi:endonuclease YncB( thermonuclease family)
VRVIDGDTIELAGGDHLRLQAIDAPEKNDPYYMEATDLLAALTVGREVSVMPMSAARDRYGRLLGLVYVDSVLVNRVLVDSGLACLYLFDESVPDHPELQRLLTAQRSALDRRVGMWSVAHEPEPYYINPRNSKRFHRPTCLSLIDHEYPEGDRVATREEALRRGLSPCRRCRP